MLKPNVDIEALPTESKLDLIEQLWESLSADSNSVPLTIAQRKELDRRLDEMEADGGGGIPWEEVLRRIKGGR
jgi:putative addiction module component (TIGR02574 family)